MNSLLFIEDDDGIRLALKLALEDEGYEVREAPNGRAGLEMFAEREPWGVFAWLQEHAPVYRHPEPGTDGFWCVTKYDDVLDVLKRAKVFSSQAGGSARIGHVEPDVLEARRNFMDALRSAGEQTRGPAALSKTDIQAFANELDKFLTRHRA